MGLAGIFIVGFMLLRVGGCACMMLYIEAFKDNVPSIKAI